jgi:hypothetical protein
MDDDDDGGGEHDELDDRQGDNDIDGIESKFGKRVGKRKLKETNKTYSNEPVPSKLFKQMQTLLDFVIKYRDK